ncbi:rho GTPase-activating protein 21-like isoform X2 [Hippocampus zosterae]|uniref:rho GTPase-activating protein 21-like isoform X2 n=1 Tax=Hippocampus zosterae TaxID=109293 RepID=UPI00223DF383|nr:rho GTPase-activating protein 21-like isoform X2 [Hippocampus zosterae]
MMETSRQSSMTAVQAYTTGCSRRACSVFTNQACHAFKDSQESRIVRTCNPIEEPESFKFNQCPTLPAKGLKDNLVSSNEHSRRPLSSGNMEGMSWCGLQTVYLQKDLQGFGFTLRHFIVYPPESYLHNSKDEENGNAVKTCGQQCHLEAVDTIFVKSVKENSPAHRAGLCTGDRLVKVNGESILGKTYSQVIRLIQSSEKNLELSVMPKDKDVLQLISAYSQEACFRVNDTFSIKDHNLHEPPLRYCSSTNPNSIASQLSHKFSSVLDNCQCRPSPTTSPTDRRHVVASPNNWTKTPEEVSDNFVTTARHRGRSSSAISALDFHFANHNAAIASATPPRKSSLPASGHTDSLYHRALSDQYCCQAEVAEHPATRRCSIPQGLYAGPTYAATVSAETQRPETVLSHHQTAADFHHSHLLGEWSGISRAGSMPCSESLLAAYAKYEYNYGRSVETLEKASAMVPPYSDSSSKFSQQKVQKDTGENEHQIQKATVSSTVSPCRKQSGQQVAEPQTRRMTDELAGYKNGSPTMSRESHRLPQPAQTLREPSNCGPDLSSSPDGRRNAATGEVEQVTQSQWTTTQPASEDRTHMGCNRDVISPISLKRPLCHRTLAQTLKSPQSPESLSESPSPVSVGPGSSRSTNGSLVQQAYNSLSSIPFIGSIKGRRSSYLLAISTERSKSCDEGLNTLKEEGHVLTRLPKRVKSFFIDGSLESLKAQEEARSKRHSTSELGSITFSDICKEGWLHYKQILTDKGKKVGSSMRTWKRLFFVLRSRVLFIYKDKREAILHGAGPGSGLDEHPPINICGCLIDIAYRETKRKHTLRLMTQDFCEYLLQAENRDEMLAWIKVITENSKTDNEEIGSSRQVLINKKLNDYRKQSLTGNKPDSSLKTHRMMPPFLLAKNDNTTANRSSKSVDNKTPWGINIMKKSKKTDNPKAFGVRLENCQQAEHHKFVPQIVEMCCDVVEATGLDYTGIYRVPGNNAMVSNLQEHLNKGFDINTAEERWQDLNVISSLLKAFLRKLPEPLFTDDKYIYFIDANRIEDTWDRLKTLKKLIHDLPDHYYHTLKFLMCHLKRVADHSEKNKMEPRNLALVFGPTLVRTSEDNMTDMVTHMPDRYKIVETLILHCDWFFSGGELDKQQNTPDEEMQHMPNIDHLLCNIGRTGMPGETSDSTPSDSVKAKRSLSSLKDPNARETLSKSIASAVTRKRKKCPSGHLPDGSSDEGSVHGPMKANNYGQTEQMDGKEMIGKDNAEQSVLAQMSTVDNRNGVTQTTVGKCESYVVEKEFQAAKDTKSDKQNTTVPQVCRKSFRYSCNQINNTYPRPLPMTSPQNLTRERSKLPIWIFPTRLRDLCQASKDQSNMQLVWSQPVPIFKKKSRGRRTKALSLNFDIQLDDIVRERKTEDVEIITAHERDAPHHISQLSPAPGLVQGENSYSLLVDHNFLSSSSVARRRSAMATLVDKKKAWHRHSVFV